MRDIEKGIGLESFGFSSFRLAHNSPVDTSAAFPRTTDIVFVEKEVWCLDLCIVLLFISLVNVFASSENVGGLQVKCQETRPTIHYTVQAQGWTSFLGYTMFFLIYTYIYTTWYASC